MDPSKFAECCQTLYNRWDVRSPPPGPRCDMSRGVTGEKGAHNPGKERVEYLQSRTVRRATRGLPHDFGGATLETC